MNNAEIEILLRQLSKTEVLVLHYYLKGETHQWIALNILNKPEKESWRIMGYITDLFHLDNLLRGKIRLEQYKEINDVLSVLLNDRITEVVYDYGRTQIVFTKWPPKIYYYNEDLNSREIKILDTVYRLSQIFSTGGSVIFGIIVCIWNLGMLLGIFSRDQDLYFFWGSPFWLIFICGSFILKAISNYLFEKADI